MKWNRFFTPRTRVFCFLGFGSTCMARNLCVESTPCAIATIRNISNQKPGLDHDNELQIHASRTHIRTYVVSIVRISCPHYFRLARSGIFQFQNSVSVETRFAVHGMISLSFRCAAIRNFLVCSPLSRSSRPNMSSFYSRASVWQKA